MADTIVFAGLFAIFQCRGPAIPFVPGRGDSLVANPVDRLPGPISTSEETLSIFVNRMGFTPEETVAIIGGAHSVAQVHRVNVLNLAVKEGAMDATINIIDNLYYRQLLAAPELAKLPADVNLLNDTQLRAAFVSFSQDQDNLFLPAFKAGILKMTQFIPFPLNMTAPFPGATTLPVDNSTNTANASVTAASSATLNTTLAANVTTGAAAAGAPSNFTQPSAFSAPSSAPHADPAASNGLGALATSGSFKADGSGDLLRPASDASTVHSTLAATIMGCTIVVASILLLL